MKLLTNKKVFATFILSAALSSVSAQSPLPLVIKTGASITVKDLIQVGPGGIAFTDTSDTLWTTSAGSRLSISGTPTRLFGHYNPLLPSQYQIDPNGWVKVFDNVKTAYIAAISAAGSNGSGGSLLLTTDNRLFGSGPRRPFICYSPASVASNSYDRWTLLESNVKSFSMYEPGNADRRLTVRLDGTFWSSGHNAYGRLGTTGNTHTNTTSQCSPATHAQRTTIGAGGVNKYINSTAAYTTVLLMNDGSLNAVGANSAGSSMYGWPTVATYNPLGTGSIVGGTSFVQSPPALGAFLNYASTLGTVQAATGITNILLKQDGTLHISTNGASSYTLYDSNVKEIYVPYTGTGNNYILYTDNNDNLYEIVGLSRTKTFRIANVKEVKLSLTNAFALTNTKLLYGRGTNSNGELGLGHKTAQSSFVQINNNVEKLVVSDTTIAVSKTDNSIWFSGKMGSNIHTPTYGMSNAGAKLPISWPLGTGLDFVFFTQIKLPDPSNLATWSN